MRVFLRGYIMVFINILIVANNDIYSVFQNKTGSFLVFLYVYDWKWSVTNFYFQTLFSNRKIIFTEINENIFF